jgi:hypothetical protein
MSGNNGTAMNKPLGNSMADHHHGGHVVTPGVGTSVCSCGHVWAHNTSWLDNKYGPERNR